MKKLFWYCIYRCWSFL